MPPQLKQVLTARSSQQVLGLTGTVIDGASIKQAHRKLALACHPDRHCSYPDAAVCTSAHIAAVLLNNARDDLLSTAAHAQMIRPKIEDRMRQNFRMSSHAFRAALLCTARPPIITSWSHVVRLLRGASQRRQWCGDCTSSTAIMGSSRGSSHLTPSSWEQHAYRSYLQSDPSQWRKAWLSTWPL